MTDLFSTLLSIPTASGAEQALCASLAAALEPYTDTITTDALGSLIATRRARGNAVSGALAFVCSLDFPGRIVTYIEESGLCRTAPVGRPEAAGAVYSTVTDGTHSALLIPDKNAKDGGELLADFGVSQKDTVPVHPGDILCYSNAPLTLADGAVCAPALGSKLCALALCSLAARQIEVPFDVHYLFCTQSSLGNRGAAPAAFAVPFDRAIGVQTYEGKTPGICLLDKVAVYDKPLTDALCRVGEAVGVPLTPCTQSEKIYDTARIQSAGSGIKTGLLLLPVSYSGSVREKGQPQTATQLADIMERFLKDN